MKTQAELRKFNQETTDSVRGKNNHLPKPKSEGNAYWPDPHVHDLPHQSYERENDEY